MIPRGFSFKRTYIPRDQSPATDSRQIYTPRLFFVNWNSIYESGVLSHYPEKVISGLGFVDSNPIELLGFLCLSYSWYSAYHGNEINTTVYYGAGRGGVLKTIAVLSSQV